MRTALMWLAFLGLLAACGKGRQEPPRAPRDNAGAAKPAPATSDPAKQPGAKTPAAPQDTTWPVAAPEGPIVDSEISLRQLDVFETYTPPALAENTSPPGDKPAVVRPHPTAPPVIPHGIRYVATITARENQCIDCHRVDEKLEGEATPIPPTHLTDLRRTPDQVGHDLVGARYDCTACHVPQHDAPPLVANQFPGAMGGQP